MAFILSEIENEVKPMFVNFTIERYAFGGACQTKGIMLFPIYDKNQLEDLIKKMSNEFCTYLSEFNRNEVSEYDDRCRALCEEVYSENDTEKLSLKLKLMCAGWEPVKSIYVAAHKVPRTRLSVRTMSHYAVNIDISPACRQKSPENVFVMTLMKAYDADKAFIDELKSKDYGQFKFVSNILQY